MKKIRVNVTANDIAKGKRDNCLACPVSRAIARAIKDKGAAVFVGKCSVYVGSTGRRYTLPIEVSKFIEMFDNRRKVSPIRFTLTLS